MTPRAVEDFAARLEQFGRDLERLEPPCRRNPDKFHEQKSEMRKRARALAVEFRNGFGAPQKRGISVEGTTVLCEKKAARKALATLFRA